MTLLLFAAPVWAADIGTDITPHTLAVYIEGATGGLDLSAMSAVGAVIVNRCASDRYPDTVISNGAALGIMPSPTPSDMAMYAAKLAISGFDPTGGAVCIFRRAASSSPANRGKHIVYAVGDLCFATD